MLQNSYKIEHFVILQINQYTFLTPSFVFLFRTRVRRLETKYCTHMFSCLAWTIHAPYSILDTWSNSAAITVNILTDVNTLKI